ncbi:MAG: hypothetical protein Q4P24_15810 [Rhodobacterales bacterium]|nr:hypothetical protein [Rhodobacterales bacterium]
MSKQFWLIESQMVPLRPFSQDLRARRYLPWDAQVAALSDQEMKAICDRLNSTPRKCLGWRTSTEVFKDELMKLR